MPEEAVTAVEKGPVAAGEECSMRAKAEVTTHTRPEALRMHSAECQAAHPNPASAVHASEAAPEATTCQEREGAWCGGGISNGGTGISVGRKRER